jgi:N-acyl-D-aspartate/D-glutamate deacylase
MVWVFVNGQAAIRDGELTDVRSGRVLRKGM